MFKRNKNVQQTRVLVVIAGILLSAMFITPGAQAAFSYAVAGQTSGGAGIVQDCPLDSETAVGAKVRSWISSRSGEIASEGEIDGSAIPSGIGQTTDLVDDGSGSIGRSWVDHAFSIDAAGFSSQWAQTAPYDDMIIEISKDTGNGGYTTSCDMELNTVDYYIGDLATNGGLVTLHKIGGENGTGVAGDDYLAAWRISETSTYLDWPAIDDEWGNVYGYRVYRSNGGPLTHLTYVDSPTTEYTDPSCAAGQSYNYTISIMYDGSPSNVESLYDSYPVNSPPDTTIPAIDPLEYPSDPSTAGDALTVIANVSDDTDVSNVYLNFTTPTQSQNMPMTETDAYTETYGPTTLTKYANYTYTINEQTMGTYTWHIAAVDSSGNWNETTPVNFYLDHSTPDYLNISVSPGTMTAGDTSTVTVSIFDQYDNPANVTGDMGVDLSTNSTSPNAEFNDTVSTITSVAVLDGTNNATCNYYDEKTSTPTWTLTAENLLLPAVSGLNSNTTTIVVNPNVTANIDIAPTLNISIDADDPTWTITAWANDTYGNVVADGTQIDWTVNGTGAVGPNPSFTVGGVATTLLTMPAVTDSECNVSATNNGESNTTANITVIPGLPFYLVVENVGNQVAGVEFQVNVSVEDFNNNPTNYTGTVTITGNASDAPDTTAPDYESPYAFVGEQYHVFNVTLYANQTGVQLTASGTGGIAPDTNDPFNVNSTGLDHIDVEPLTPTDISADLVLVLIKSTARDAYNNTVGGVPIEMRIEDNGTQNIKGPIDSAGIWTLTFTNTTSDFADSNGEYTVNMRPSDIAGDDYFIKAISGAITNISSILTVVPGNITSMSITPNVVTPISVDDNTTGITIEIHAEDVFGNNATDAIISWSVNDWDFPTYDNNGTPSFDSLTSTCNSTGNASVLFFPGQSSGDNWYVTATNISSSFSIDTPQEIYLTPGYVKTLVLDTPTIATNISADDHEIMVQITAIDQWGNFVPNADIDWTFEDWDMPTNDNIGVPTFDVNPNTTDVDGQCVVWLDTDTFAGDNWRINATNDSVLWGSVENSTLEILIVPGVGITYQITPNPHTMGAGDDNTFTVNVTDKWGNPRPAIQYTTIVLLTDSPTGVFYDPGTLNLAPFVTIDNGSISDTFNYSDTTAGTWTITGIDTSSTPLLDNTTLVTVTPGPAANLVADKLGGNTAPGINLNLGVDVEDVYGNMVTDYTGQVHFETDCPDSWIPANYTYLLADSGTHTFDVMLNSTGTWYLNVSMIGAPNDYENYTWTVGGAADHVDITPVMYWEATVDDEQTFTAMLYDGSNNVLPGNFTWTTNDTTGTLFGGYYNPVTPGNYTIWVNETESGIDSIIIVNISAGLLDYITLTVTAGTTTFTANGSVNISAAGFDQYDNPVATTPSWGTTGSGTLSVWTDIANYTDTTAGTYEIWANDSGVNSSMMVTVNADILDDIIISPAPGITTITADENQLFTALGYDQWGNLVDLAGPAWSTNGGNMNSTGVYAPGSTGLWTIYAEESGVNKTSNIQVDVGQLAYIQIEDGTGPGANPILDIPSLSSTSSLTVYAVGYDSKGNWRGAVNVDWNVTGTLNTSSLPPGMINTFSFNPVEDGTSGKITANDNNGHVNMTGLLTISQWNVTSVIIMNASSGAATWIGDTTITTDGTIILYAIGYNATKVTDGGRIGPVSVIWTGLGNWAGNNSIGTSSYTFNPTALGTGTFNITYTGPLGTFYNDTGTLTVTLGDLHHITITNTTTTTTIISNQTLNLTAVGYDQHNNVNTTTLTWEAENGTVIGTEFFPWSTGTWTIYANATNSTGVTKTGTYTITVTAGLVANIAINPLAPGIFADNTQQFTATATDAYGNPTVFSNLQWTAEAGSIDQNGLYTPGPPGVWTIWANDTIEAVTTTAVINVVNGPIVSIEITPVYSVLQPGETQDFNAAAYDVRGNEVTSNDASFTWWAAGGAIDNNTGVYTANFTNGVFNITANLSGETGIAEVTILTGGGYTVNNVTIKNSSVAPYLWMGDTSMTTDDSMVFYAIGWNDTKAINEGDGHIGPVFVNWTTNGGLELLTYSGTTFVFDPTTPGVGTINATPAGGIGNDTGTITVIVGDLASITVTPSTATVDADTTGFDFNATGYDADGNVNTTVVFNTWWAQNGTINSTGAFNASKVGTWTILANNSGINGSAMITVTPGALDNITVAPTAQNITADETKSFTATGYDQHGNLVILTATAWTTNGGTINSTTGVYTPNLVGAYNISATDTGISGNTTINVTVGNLAYIQIFSGGSLVADQNMNSIGILNVSAQGFDANGNFISDSIVTWEVTGTLNDTSLPGVPQTSFDFEPYTDGTIGRVVARDTFGNIAATGILTITQWTVDYIAVETNPLAPSPVGPTTITTDDTLTLYAIGYNVGGGGRLGPVSVDWTNTSSLENITFTGSSYTYIPTIPGGVGTINITFGGTLQNETGTITVVLGDLVTITVTNTTSVTTTDADHVVNFTAEGFDLDTNPNGTVTFTWTAENGTINTTGTYTPWSVGTWTIWANATNSTGVTKTGTYTIIVTEGDLDHIYITPTDPTITADEVQLFTALGYDQWGNTVDISPVWETDGGAMNATTGVYSPFSDGPYNIWANDTGIIGTTTITVTIGVLDTITITGTTNIIAGGYTNLTAEGFDQNGNTVVLVANPWESSDGTIDTWGNFTQTAVGTYTVWANDSGVNTSVTITVTANSLATITVLPNTPTIAANQTIQFTATGIDAYGNPVPISPVWTTDGGSIDQAGLYTPGPNSFTVWNIWATDTIVGTTTITVNPGPIALIQITPAFSVLQPGETQDYDATAYDVRGNVVPFTGSFGWEATGGAIDGSGIYTAGSVAGTYAIWANDTAIGTSNASIVVGGGGWEPDVITVGDAGGTPIGPVGLTTDGTITFYAWGYNATKDANDGNGTIGPLDVNWITTGTLESLTIIGESSITFDPTTPGVGTIRATHLGSSEMDDTGTITITLGVLDHITITGNATVDADSITTFNATGYDADNNMIPGLNFTWTATNGAIAQWDDDSANFTPMNTGVITLDAGNDTVNGTFDVTVTPGTVATITPTMTNLTIGAGNSTTVDATAYDVNGNVVPATLTWTVPIGTRTALGAYTAPTAVGNGTIVVSFGTVSINISVTVTPNALNSIYLVSDVGGTSTSLALLLNDVVVFTATPKDMYGNNRTDPIVITATAGVMGLNGIYTASTTNVPDPGTVTAASGAVQSQISVTIGVGPITSIVITPADPTLEAGMVHIFSAVAYDAAGNIVNTVFTWTTTAGNIGILNSNGILDAANNASTGFVEASAGGVTGSSNVSLTISPSAQDADGDGIPDTVDPDADGDGIPDAWADSNGIASPDADDDGDGLTNMDEYYLGTDPSVSDTDGDGVPDGEDSQPLSPLPTGDDGGSQPALFFVVIALAALATVELLIIIFKKKK